MHDPRDTIDIRLAPQGQGNAGAANAPGRPVEPRRPFLQLWFRCAGQYARAYRNADGTGYLGRCPTCAKAIRFRVGRGGTSERFFEISC